jgi:hypothetical protein
MEFVSHTNSKTIPLFTDTFLVTEGVNVEVKSRTEALYWLPSIFQATGLKGILGALMSTSVSFQLVDVVPYGRCLHSLCTDNSILCRTIF